MAKTFSPACGQFESERSPAAHFPIKVTHANGRMLPLRLHPEADAEAIEAATYIKADDPAQGWLFVQALETAIKSARTQPDLHPCFDGDFRKVSVCKFRYAVVFREHSECSANYRRHASPPKARLLEIPFVRVKPRKI